jgi:hypothetical protein
MAQFVDCSFEGATVVLDGNEYLRCKFLRCRVVVTRGNFSLRDSSFDSCNFEFGGEAANIKTLVLSLMNQAPAPGGQQAPKP